MQKNEKIYVAGHRGLVGSAIVRRLRRQGYNNLTLRAKKEVDLRNQDEVGRFFDAEKPEYVFLAAARVGGILANNTYPADFIRDNLLIQTNVIHSSYSAGVKKLLFLGSSCIYPKQAPQPMKEEYFLDGKLEPTNEPYAIAKVAGITMCQSYNRQYAANFISVMPTNLYGPNDNFDLETSHVIPALIRKFVEAKENNDAHVTIWGSGKPRREFLHVDDLADACFYLMENYNESEILNIGTGVDISIKELALLIQSTVGFDGDLVFDASKPDGTSRKLLDVTKMSRLGWRAGISLPEGLRQTVDWYVTSRRSQTIDA